MYKNRQIHLCAFYNFGLFPSYLRFVEQLSPLQQRYNITTHIYNEYTLPRDEKFDLLLRPKMKQGRGFGYWCWKPYIILHTLQAMQEGDILLYIDIGCEIFSNNYKRLEEYFDMVIEYGALCSYLTLSKEGQWTKSDIFAYFGMLKNADITDSPHRAGGITMWEKNEKNIRLVTQWLQVYYDDFSLIDDSPSKIPNLEGFVENRHDQSIFSILSKMYDIKALDFIQEFENRDAYYNNIYTNPIYAARNKVWLSNIRQSTLLRTYIKVLAALCYPLHRAKRHQCHIFLQENLNFVLYSVITNTPFMYSTNNGCHLPKKPCNHILHSMKTLSTSIRYKSIILLLSKFY